MEPDQSGNGPGLATAPRHFDPFVLGHDRSCSGSTCRIPVCKSGGYPLSLTHACQSCQCRHNKRMGACMRKNRLEVEAETALVAMLDEVRVDGTIHAKAKALRSIPGTTLARFKSREKVPELHTISALVAVLLP